MKITMSSSLLLLVFLGPASSQQLSDTISTQRHNVVKLRSHPSDRSVETSTGIYVGKDQRNAYFVTALHSLFKQKDVADPVETLMLQFYGTPTTVDAKVLNHFDETLDLAVVYIPVADLPGGTVPMVATDASAELVVHIIGHPAAGDWALWTGSIQNEVGVGGNGQFFATSADRSISTGFSGGPVFDSHGSFVGMHLSSAISYTKNLKSSPIISALKAWRVPMTNFSDSNSRQHDVEAVDGTIARRQTKRSGSLEVTLNSCKLDPEGLLCEALVTNLGEERQFCLVSKADSSMMSRIIDDHGNVRTPFAISLAESRNFLIMWECANLPKGIPVASTLRFTADRNVGGKLPEEGSRLKLVEFGFDIVGYGTRSPTSFFVQFRDVPVTR